MVKARQPVTDPAAYTTFKICTLCKENKPVAEFPLNYRKNVGEKYCKYRSRCYICHNARLRELYIVRKSKKLIVNFDEEPNEDHLSTVSDGALMNIEKVEDNKEK